MNPQFLLDTHTLVRWATEPRRLSREQLRVLQNSVRRGEPLGISGITLMELALLFRAGKARIRVEPEELLRPLEFDPSFKILPLTVDVARELESVLPVLRDPVDATIAATARVHGLRLVTSDQRILAANVVSTVG